MLLGLEISNILTLHYHCSCTKIYIPCHTCVASFTLYICILITAPHILQFKFFVGSTFKYFFYNNYIALSYQLKLLIASRASSVPSCQWLYVITFGGGLVEGDNVCVDVKVGELSTVVVTTQASTKVCYTVIKLFYTTFPQRN